MHVHVISADGEEVIELAGKPA
ncbi:hypothetical protein LOC54_09070 [Acetobacter sp. AN02]|nr:hypothetical protein [Acetobacter sp. AN02]MDG6095252.1 hypothetical protein [Acetobacter sp. AN02]